MRLALTGLLVLLFAAPAQAATPGTLQDLSATWGGIAKCSTGYDATGEAITETCRTLHYCRMRIVKVRRERVLRISNRCVKVAPWQQGTRTR